MNWKTGTAFVALSLVWGSSFMWIGVALDEHIAPMTVATIRVGLGLLGLLAVLLIKKVKLPREPRLWLLFSGTALLNVVLPFPLISWAGTRIDSSLSAVLNGTVPLFTTLFAHVCFHDEKLSLPRFIGLMCGFCGVVVLSSRTMESNGKQTTLPGILAMLAAATCYGLNNVYSKRFLRGQPPLLTATMTLLIAFATLCPIWLVMEYPVRMPVLPLTWFALCWLGFLGVSAAYVCFFALLELWGPTRASTVAYVFPVVGMTLGIIFRNEHPTWRLFVGSALILIGLWMINRRAKTAAKAAAA
ncbi:MAG: DMT family transporter [Planctomycetota bacterium]